MTVTIELDPDTERRIEALAARTGQSKAALLRELVANGFENVEDYFLAAEVLERIRNGEEAVYSAEAVRRELGLDD